MSNKTPCKILFPAFLFFIVLSAGCMKQGLPIYYHTLNSPGQTASLSPGTELPVILVGPVRLASFLDQGHLVKQSSDNSVSLIEQHRWAGNLSEMVSNELICQLTQSLGSEKIYSFPNTIAEDGFRLELDVLHFEQAKDGMANSTVRWRIVSVHDQTILHTATSQYRVEPKTKDYDGLAQALSQGLSRLNQEISSQILRLTTTNSRSSL